ncbi:MAG: hypothetical protein H7101_11990 [Deinococcales bacterium]|nr:hypothetical protein [Chitinophagaceae bacterium]
MNKLLPNNLSQLPLKIKNHYIATSVFVSDNMDNNFREKQRNSYLTMRMVYDFGVACLILAMAAAMFFAEKLNIPQIVEKDIMLRYIFGAVCLLYGGFRLYRGIKRDY